MIQAILQDLDAVVFCKMLSKEDRLVEPVSQNALTIFNHWRAYINFPGTSLVDEYFQGEIKIVQCDFDPVLQLDYTVQSYGNWVINRSGKAQRVFLTCFERSFLEVTRICLSSGKQVNMRNLEF